MAEISGTGRTSGPEELPDPLARQFRHHAGKVSRQASVFLSGTVFLVLGGYLFKIYVSRILGPAGLGLYALGMNMVALFSQLGALGLPDSTARFVAIYNGRGEAANVRRYFLQVLVILSLSTGLLASLMLLLRHWISGRFFREPELAHYFPIFSLLVMLGPLHLFLGQYLRGHQEVTRRTLINHFVLFPTKVLVTLALFSAGWGLGGYIAGEVSGLLLAFVLTAWVARRLTPPADPAQPAFGKGGLGRDVWHYAASMLGLAAAGYVSSRTDILILGALLTSDQVGIYAIVATTAAFVPTLLKSINTIFGPIIADLHARHEMALLERLFRTTTKWCFGLTFPLVIVLVLFGRELLGVFGPGFEAGAAALALLAIGELVNVGVGASGNLLVMSGLQRFEIVTSVTVAVLSVILNLWLIPRWGILGAAAAMAIGTAFANLARLVMVWARLKLLPYNRQSLRLLVPIAASSAVAYGIWLWLRPERSFAVMLLALALAYLTFVAVAAVFALDRDDRIIARAAWQKVRSFVPGRA